jgi:hypothetical protein
LRLGPRTGNAMMNIGEKAQKTNEFRRFIVAQVETILHDIGDSGRDDVEMQNVRAVEWIKDNAARFRDEWFRRRGMRQREG